MNWNPKSWFAKPAPVGVYVRVRMDGPFLGITATEPATWEKPFIHLKDLDLEKAAQLIPGHAIDWHRVPMWIRQGLEMDPFCLVTEWSQLKEWVR